jgi:hypothetical protein
MDIFICNFCFYQDFIKDRAINQIYVTIIYRNFEV